MKKSKFSVEAVQRALSPVKHSLPLLGTVRNKSGQLATTSANMRQLLSH